MYRLKISCLERSWTVVCTGSKTHLSVFGKHDYKEKTPWMFSHWGRLSRRAQRLIPAVGSCKEVGTLSESTAVSAEHDKLQNFKDKLFGSEAQQLTCFQRFMLLTRICVLWRLRNPTGQQRCTVALTALEKCKLPWCAVFKCLLMREILLEWQWERVSTACE